MEKESSRHILIVDDDVLTTCALKEHLEQLGYRVSIADGCSQAKETLRRSDGVDLVILDQLMADGRGTDLLQAMAEEAALQKPKVIMSSFVADPTSQTWEALRRRLPEVSQTLIHAYVGKPYTLSMMDAVVNLMLAKRPEAAKPARGEILSGDYRMASPVHPHEQDRAETSERKPL